MTLLRPQPSGIPAPRPSPRSAPYWEGCRRHELLFTRCRRCGFVGMRPFRTCAGCLAQDPEWVGSSGTGSLYSWTVVWRPQHPSFVVPYAPAVVELDEGWYLLSAVVGCEDDELSIGMRLEVEFHPVSEEITLPYFTPLRSGGTPASANGRAQGS